MLGDVRVMALSVAVKELTGDLRVRRIATHQSFLGERLRCPKSINGMFKC